MSQQVLRYPRFTIFDSVYTQVHEGVVTLSGRVTMPFKREDIARRVGSVEGVDDVRNEVTVLPVSLFDDELRFRIARAIYGNSNFWTYGAMVNPPVHIIVGERPRHARGGRAQQHRPDAGAVDCELVRCLLSDERSGKRTPK